MQAKTDIDIGQPANQIEESGAQHAPLSILRQAAFRLADTKRKPKIKTRDLVGLLLCHSARAWRNSLPKANIRLSVMTLDGINAVRLNTPAE